MALSTKNLSNAELEEIIRVNHLIEKYGAEELIKARLLSANSALLASEKTISIEKAKEHLLTANINEELREMLISKHLSTVADGEEATAKQVLIKELLDEAVAKKLITSENAKEILSSEGVILNDAKEIASKEALIEALKRERMARLSLVNVLSVGAIAFGVASIAIAKKTEESIEEVRNRAKELSDTFNDGKSSIDDYKSQIDDLYSTIKDSSSSVKEVTTARQTLMTVQDELIDKFGDEKETIDLITQAINGQSTALDELTQKQWQATKNDFNKSNWLNDFGNWQEGYSDNIDRMVNEMENAWGNIKMSTSDYWGGEYDEIIKRLEEAGWKYSSSSETFVKSGSVEDLYEEILDIQTLVGDDMPDNFLKSLTDDANELKATLDNYEGMWDNYILNDKIFADDNLADSWKEVNDAYTKYQNAVASGDKTAIEEATSGFATSINEVLNDENVSDSVKDYFKDMYPALYREVEKWEFKTNIIPEFDTKGLNGKTQADVLEMLQTEGAQDGEDVFNSIVDSAIKYGLILEDDTEGIQKILDLLVEWGILQGTIAEETQNSNRIDVFKLNTKSVSENISDLNDLEEQLGDLDTLLENFAENGTFDIKDLDAISDYFIGLENVDTDIMNSVNKALETLADPSSTLEQQSQAIDNLANAYFNVSEVANTMSLTNKDWMISEMKKMGIVNAEEVVMSRLKAVYGDVALAEHFLTQTGKDLTNATYAEIAAFLNETEATPEAERAIAQLTLSKISCNNVTIDTSADIANIYNLADAANASAIQLAELAKAKDVLTQVENGSAMGLRYIDNGEYDKALKLIESIENGTYTWKFDTVNWEPTKFTPAEFVGSDDFLKGLEESASKTEDTYKELFDFFERRIEKLNQALDLLKTNLENVVGSNAKNQLIDAQIGINQESMRNYEDALAMYTEKASEALAKIPTEFQDKIVNGAIDITEFIGSGNEELVEAIKDYQEWANKVADCQQELAELKETLRQLELEKFNNIIEDFENLTGISTNAQDLIQKQIDLFEEAGELIGAGFYEGLIKESEGQLDLLMKQREALVAEMNNGLDSGLIEIGSDEFLEMVNALNEVDSAILDTKKDIEEFNNAIQELHWEVIERIQTNFDNLSSEIDNLIGLIDDIDVSDKEGNWSSEGLAQMGLQAQEYERAIYASQMYAKEIDELNKAYLNGEYSAEEYAKKLAELKEAQWNEINASEEAKEAMMALNEARVNIMVEGIEEEIDAMKELTDSKIEALDAEKELHNYRQSLTEKNKSVTDLERQWAAIQNDDTAAGIARRKKIEEDLAKARQDLADFEYEHNIEEQKKALNQQYEDFETEKNNEIEALRATLEEEERLIAESFETVKQNAQIVGQEITNISLTYGVQISDSLVNAWQSGSNALASYGETLLAGESQFVTSLSNMVSNTYALQEQANATATSLANMYNTNSSKLQADLVNSYYSLANVNAVTQALQDSLINTLDRGYSTDSIVDEINNLSGAANTAAQAFRNLWGAMNGQNTPTTPTFVGYDVGGSGEAMYSGNGMTETAQWWFDNYGYELPGLEKPKKYASGTRSSKGNLIVTDEEGYELKLPKLSSGNYTIEPEGTQILTKVETDNIFDWAKINPNDFITLQNPFANGNYNTNIKLPNITKNSNTPTVQIHYDNLVQVQGDVNNSNIRQMESIVNNAITKQFNQFNSDMYRSGVR